LAVRPATLLFTLAAAICGGQNALAVDDGIRSEIHVTVRQGRLSVDVADVPLVDVLRAIAEQAGIRVKVEGDPGTVQPQSFTGLPLDKGMRRLLAKTSMVMFYEAFPGEPSSSRLSEIRIYGAPGVADVTIEPLQHPSPSAEETPEEGEPAVDVLAPFLSPEEDPSARRFAARRLARTAGEEAAAALTAAVQDNDPAVRIPAVRALFLSRGEEAAPLLAEIATSDEDPGVRRLAVRLLTRLDRLEAEWALHAAATRDPDATVRKAAGEALARWKSARHSR
jgi:hypothetical protein